jgi:hypothetical protein
MPTGFHPIMQDPNDLEDRAFALAIVDHVHGVSHRLGSWFTQRMSHVEASKARGHVLPLSRERAIRLRGHLLDRVEQQQIDVRCLRVLNSRQAWQFHLLPVQREGDEMQLATSADKLVRALNFATRTVRDPVFMVIAERDQLRSFLMEHYPVPQYIAQYAECM